MTIKNELRYHYNKIYNLKNIIDTDKDGVNDLIEIRTADGQLVTNPGKADINKTVKSLENMEKKVEQKINELKEAKEINKEMHINRSKDLSR